MRTISASTVVAAVASDAASLQPAAVAAVPAPVLVPFPVGGFAVRSARSSRPKGKLASGSPTLASTPSSSESASGSSVAGPISAGMFGFRLRDGAPRLRVMLGRRWGLPRTNDSCPKAHLSFSIFRKPYVLSCRMKLEKLLCLKFLGSTSDVNFSGLRTTKWSPDGDHEMMSSVSGSSTSSYAFARKGFAPSASCAASVVVILGGAFSCLH
mmetsp:Transcript_378/g.951  ORF Transcript_378/g.951 Transcript_378/m.951 type:complete len:211 (-) Transcript_378:9-641(-)